MTRHQIFNAPATLPESKRRAALELHVRKAFPFSDPEFAAYWRGTEASVYAWDRAAIHSALDEARVPRSTRILPETFVRNPGTNKARMVAMLEGFEGQLWQEGFLAASRWWPARPSNLEWSNFLRAAGLTPNGIEVAPEPLELALQDRPWTEGPFSLVDLINALQTRRAIGIAATVALCPFVLAGTSIIGLSVAESNVRAEIATLSQANQGIRQDRAASFANLEAIEEFMRLSAYPPQAKVLGTALKLLEPSGVRIASWTFDRGTLEIILRGKQEFDPTAYITMFERDDVFESVGGTLVGQERDLQLRMSVSKLPNL